METQISKSERKSTKSPSSKYRSKRTEKRHTFGSAAAEHIARQLTEYLAEENGIEIPKQEITKSAKKS